MIEDLEDASFEPTGRPHVTVLSAAVAAASLVLLLALIIAPASRRGAAPQAATPATIATTTPTLTIVSNPINQVRIDLTREIVCADGTRLRPPYQLSFSFDDGFGAIYGVPSEGGTSRSVPVAVVIDARRSRAIVTCDIFAPRVDLKTIAR